MKRVTSLSLALSFLIMTYTGIMLFVCPHGRVAYWSDWHLFGLSKTDYGNLHTTSMVVFVLFGLLHIYFNWKPIVSYMKNSAKKITFTKKEFLTALFLNLLFFIGTLSMIQPFSGFLNFEEGIKDSWTKKLGEPPYGHAELSKLKVFCRKMGIELDEAEKKLKQHSINYSIDENLKTIAEKNGMSPNDIYNIIKTDKKTDKKGDIPSSLGRRTLGALADMGAINLQKAIKILKNKGVRDIDKNYRIKDIADELDMKPIDVYGLLKEH